MTDNESHAVRDFQVETTSSGVANESDDSLAVRARKRPKLDASSGTTYMNVQFVLPTTNICERLFSQAKLPLCDRRQGILPSNFEKQMFIKQNASM